MTHQETWVDTVAFERGIREEQTQSAVPVLKICFVKQIQNPVSDQDGSQVIRIFKKVLKVADSL
jgi:hypothetical protein